MFQMLIRKRLRTRFFSGNDVLNIGNIDNELIEFFQADDNYGNLCV